MEGGSSPGERSKKRRMHNLKPDPSLVLMLEQEAATPGQVGMPPTAKISDYRAATPAQLAVNAQLLDGNEENLMMRVEGWKEDEGVVRKLIPESNGLDWANAVKEFRPRFYDGVFSLAATPKEVTPERIQGGWATVYPNSLSDLARSQRKSVLVVPPATKSKFLKTCPFMNDIVKAITSMVEKNFAPFYEGFKLQPMELTFFTGINQAACTQYHTDAEEHPKDDVVLTTLTLLDNGGNFTSMNVAGKNECELSVAGATAVFDAHLYHRSGVTYPGVLKLSIHWKKVSAVPKALVKRERGSSDDEAGEPSTDVAGSSNEVIDLDDYGNEQQQKGKNPPKVKKEADQDV